MARQLAVIPRRSGDRLLWGISLNVQVPSYNQGDNDVGQNREDARRQGKQHCDTVAKDAKVTCDGQASKAGDLKAGWHVRVTIHKDDKNVSTAVDSGKHIPAAGHKA